MDDPREWLEQLAISEVECLVPDLNGVLRGKILPTAKFLTSLEDARDLPADQRLHRRLHRPLLRCPRRWLRLSGPGHADAAGYRDALPCARRRSVQSLCLRRCLSSRRPAVDGLAASCPEGRLDLYRQRGWRAVVAPEMEFYLTAPNPDPDRPLTAPVGRTGRAETGAASL